VATTREIALILRAHDQATAEIRRVGDSFDALQSAGRALMGVLGPLAAGLAVREIIDARLEWDRYTVALTAVMGSQAEANRELEWLRELADRLGIDLQSAAAGYTQFAAAARGTAIEGAETRRVFEAVASAASVLGLSADDTSGALTALSQMISKGKVSAEELRGQLGERLPGAFNIAADAMGVTTGELDKMLQKGEVIADDFLPKFADAVMEAFGPGVAAASESSLASINRFNNSLLDLKLEMADAGIFDVFVSAAEALSEAMQDPGLINSIRSIGAQFEDIASGSGNNFVLLFQSAIKAFEMFSLGIQVPLTLIKVSGEVIAATLAAASLAIEGDFKGALEVLKDPRPAEVLAESFEQMSRSAEIFWGSSQQAAAGVEAVTDAVEEAAPVLIDWGVVMKDSIIDTEAAADANRENGEAVDEAKEKILAAKEAAIIRKQAELELTGVTRDASRALAEKAIADEAAGRTAEKGAEALRKQQENAAKLALELKKIASDERIRNIELAVELNIAKLESDTKKFESIMDSINTTIDSTGTLIGTLFGEMNEAGSRFDMNRIQSQIDEENDRRDAALQLQKDMTEAQIALIEAKTKSLENGDALIKITADGLEPEIEAFMWQILERIQVRVAEEQAELLLGV
jgi:tape measure domain-containing protein